MSTENETMGELVADMKDGKPVTWAQVNSAWTAEREALLKRARDNYEAGFAKGKEAADACLKPDPRWKERCEKCFENNACEPPECRYFDGEDCQSPIPNQHPMAQPGNVAALREAAEKTRATLEKALQILNGISDEEAGTLNARLEDVADEICEVTQWIIPDALAAPATAEKSSASGNAAKLREALLRCDAIAQLPEVRNEQSIKDMRNIIKRALSGPPRQCDVGTAEEQTARYRKFCSSHKYLGSDFSHMCRGFGKGRCPFFNSRTKSQCEFAWSQMPYEAEEGGVE